MSKDEATEALAYRYTALELIQQPQSMPMYLTMIAASELLEWSDVPRTRGDYMAGYQRSLEKKRTQGITSYLKNSPNNLIPGAIIVSVDSDSFSRELATNEIASISIAKDTRDFETKLFELWGQFTMRMSEEELNSAGIDFISPSSGYQDRSEDEDGPPDSYLASLAKELNQAVQSFDSLPIERQSAITEFIEGTSKPGLIIDGQHRVFGSKDVDEFEVLLPVVLIPGLPTSEQVFQFYVLNSTAKPLKKTELRRIVSTSLSSGEIDEMWARFHSSGLDPEEAQWTFQLHTLPESPFHDLIDFGFSNPGVVIKENVADQLVRGFVKMSRAKYGQLISPPEVNWDDSEHRMELFLTFWTAISEEYEGAWESAIEDAKEGKQAQIFMKVALLSLQTFLLNELVGGLTFRTPDEPAVFQKEELDKMVRLALRKLPADFFLQEWKAKQMDTSAGRQDLVDAMRKVAHDAGGKVKKNLWPFKA